MILLFLLVILLCLGMGNILKVAIRGKSNRIASVAGWLLILTPVLILLVGLLKRDGPLFWYTLPDKLFSPLVSIPLAVLYLLVVPFRSAWRRAHLYRDEATLLERSRTLDLKAWPGLDYQTLADQLGVPAVPIHLSMDVQNPYAIGFPKRRIILPAGMVPKEIRCDCDEYWFDVENEPISTEDMRAILSHELAHHGDFAGLKGILMELAGYLLPWEFVAGSGIEYAGGLPILSNPIKRRAAFALTCFSVWLVKIGRPVWRVALDAERNRQERIADEEAIRVFPPSRYIIESMRGYTRAFQDNSTGSGIQVFALFLAMLLLGAGLILLPGRGAMPRLFGGESPIPWHLPEGWVVTDQSPPAGVSHAGFLPATQDRPARIRVKYTSSLDDSRALAIVSTRFYFPEGVFKMPPGSRLQVDWPETVRLSWIERVKFSYPMYEHNSPILAHLIIERGSVKADESLQFKYEAPVQIIPAGKGRKIVRIDWGPWGETPDGAATLDIGMRLYCSEPGTYDLEAPDIKILCADGAILRLDQGGASRFVAYQPSPGQDR